MDSQQFFQPSGSRFRSSVTCKRCHVPCAPLISTAVPLHSTAFTTRWGDFDLYISISIYIYMVYLYIWIYIYGLITWPWDFRHLPLIRGPQGAFRSTAMEEHGKIGALMVQGLPGRSIGFSTENAGFNDALLRLTDSDVELLMVPQKRLFRDSLGDVKSSHCRGRSSVSLLCTCQIAKPLLGIGCTDCITQIYGNEVKVCGDDCVCAWPFQAQAEFQTVSQCDNKNAAGLCDNQQNWCKQVPGQEISMIFHVCMLLVRGVCPPPAHALFYG